MKTRKFLLILAAAVMLSSCANAKGNKTLIEQGLSLASLMSEKANSETYLTLVMGANDEAMGDKIREIGSGDVSKPTAVHCVSGDFSEFYSTMLSGLGGVLNADFAKQFSPELKADTEKQLLSAVASILIAQKSGSTDLAATSILASETAFDCPELKEDCLYIFTFKKAYPVAVSFTRRQGNAVSAKANFVPSKDFTDELSALLSEMGGILKIEKVQ